jgi:hypothetical protein
MAYPLSSEKAAMSITRRKMLHSSLLCTAGMVYGSAPAFPQELAGPPTSAERNRLARLAADFMDTYEVPGLSVAIAIKGKPAYVEAFGVADREASEARTPQHRFRIASISKPITSTGIFTLIEAGKLQLDSHVFGPNSILGDDYPTPPNHRSNIDQITIEHLLTHTTGGWKNDAGDPMGLDKKMNHRELIAWALEHNDLADPPGKTFAYSNFGYCHINGFKDADQLLNDDTLRTMTTPTIANPRYAKGLFVNPQNNWWHEGSLPGTATISVRTHSDFCWSAFTNTRSKFGDMGSALDRLPWHMVASVADWASMAR